MTVHNLASHKLRQSLNEHSAATAPAPAVRTVHERIIFEPDLCKGCFLCIEICPRKAISVSKALNARDYRVIEFAPAEGGKPCSGCGLCAMICPDFAIRTAG
ncbi:MAG: 4Fe-4S binding protein [Deltaproteobacteria bacterium]|nr:4Fe-4S binding protein [Deltaproteobacteria bacterium]